MSRLDASITSPATVPPFRGARRGRRGAARAGHLAHPRGVQLVDDAWRPPAQMSRTRSWGSAPRDHVRVGDDEASRRGTRCPDRRPRRRRGRALVGRARPVPSARLDGGGRAGAGEDVVARLEESPHPARIARSSSGRRGSDDGRGWTGPPRTVGPFARLKDTTRSVAVSPTSEPPAASVTTSLVPSPEAAADQPAVEVADAAGMSSVATAMAACAPRSSAARR